jgi:hypothetical protein
MKKTKKQKRGFWSDVFFPKFVYKGKKYRVVKKWNDYHGEMYDIQEKFLIFLWGSSYNNWFINKSDAIGIAKKMEKGKPLLPKWEKYF